MATETEVWTRQRIIDLPDDGQRHELIDGEHIVTPSPRHVHQWVLGELFILIKPFVDRLGLGRTTLSPADINLTGDEILQPDLFVISSMKSTGDWADVERLSLVIEALSPSTAKYDRGIKRQRYQRGGVDEYWIVDIDARIIERWLPGDTRPEVAITQLEWRPAGATESLIIDVQSVFTKAIDGPS